MDPKEAKQIAAYLINESIPSDIKNDRHAVYRFKNKCARFSLDGQTLLYNSKRCIMLGDVNETLTKLYNDPATSRNGMHSFFNRVYELYHGISFQDVRDFLMSQPSYQQHRQAIKPYQTQPLIVTQPRKYIQIDLIDLSDVAHQNNNYSHAMTAIDVMSKYAWVVPIKGAKSSECARALRLIMADNPDIQTIHTDNGKEFMGDFLKLIQENNIRLVHSRSHNPNSQGHIERFNRTIKSLIYSTMTRFNTKLWVPVIGDLVKSYNTSYHSTIKAKPIDVFNSKSRDVLEEAGSNIQHAAQGKLNLIARALPAIKKGDKVRVLLSAISADKRKAIKSGFDKGYRRVWSADVYEVDKVYRVSEGNKTYSRVLVNGHRLYLHEILKVEDIDQDQKPQLSKYINLKGFGRK